jgi:CheY-like chemotaxis protein
MNCFRCTLVGQPVRLTAFHQALNNRIFPFPGEDTSDADFSPDIPNPMSARDDGGRVLNGPSFSLLTLKPKKGSKPARVKPRTSGPSPVLRHRKERSTIPSLVIACDNDGGEGQLEDKVLPTSEGGTFAIPGRVRVLLADDDATRRNSLLQYLVGEGFEVDTVGDGSEALSRTARVDYDAVLMDGFMPVQV